MATILMTYDEMPCHRYTCN